MSKDELAVGYATAILHDAGIEVTSDKISDILKAANVKVEPYWPALFAGLAAGRNLDELLTGDDGAAPAPAAAAAPAKKDKAGY